MEDNILNNNLSPEEDNYPPEYPENQTEKSQNSPIDDFYYDLIMEQQSS